MTQKKLPRTKKCPVQNHRSHRVQIQEHSLPKLRFIIGQVTQTNLPHPPALNLNIYLERN